MPDPRLPLLMLNFSPIFLSKLFTLKLSTIQKGSARYCIWVVSRQIRSHKEVTKHVITVVPWHKSGQVKSRELGIAKYCSVVPYIGVLESNKHITTDSTCFQVDIGRLQRDLRHCFWTHTTASITCGIILGCLYNTNIIYFYILYQRNYFYLNPKLSESRASKKHKTTTRPQRIRWIFFLKCQVQLTGLEPSYWVDILRSRTPAGFSNRTRDRAKSAVIYIYIFIERERERENSIFK